MIGSWYKVVKKGKFFIKFVYKVFRGDVQNVDWKGLICFNFVFVMLDVVFLRMRWKQLMIYILILEYYVGINVYF